jgi:uncharacterized membrane protein
MNREKELEKKLKEFDGSHDEWIGKLRLAVGRFQRLVGSTPVGRFMMANVSTRIAGWLLVRFKVLGMEPGGDAVNIAYNWQKLATFLRIPVEVESADADKVILTHKECTVGFTTKDLKVCQASMNMDKTIVRRLGGKLTVVETLTQGAPRCRHIIEKVKKA